MERKQRHNIYGYKLSEDKYWREGKKGPVSHRSLLFKPTKDYLNKPLQVQPTMENSAPSDKPMEGKPTPSFDRFVLFVNKQSPTQSAKEALTVALNGNTQINNFNLLDKVDTIREDASSAAVQVLQDAPIPADKVWEMYEVLKSSPGVTHVEPLFYDMAARVPRVTEEAPPGHPDYWTIKAMNVEAAWKETEGIIGCGMNDIVRKGNINWTFGHRIYSAS